MEKQTSVGNGANKGKGVKIAFIACIVVIIVLIGTIMYLLLNKYKENDTPKRDVVVNEQNAEQVASDVVEQEYIPIGSYQVTMNSTWNFASGDVASDNAYVENAKANTNAVYFDIVRSDTEETIYESPVLPVGAYLDEIKLDKVLKAGTYDCVLTYHLVDDNQKPISKLNMGLSIVIAN